MRVQRVSNKKTIAHSAVALVRAHGVMMLVAVSPHSRECLMRGRAGTPTLGPDAASLYSGMMTTVGAPMVVLGFW